MNKFIFGLLFVASLMHSIENPNIKYESNNLYTNFFIPLSNVDHVIIDQKYWATINFSESKEFDLFQKVMDEGIKQFDAECKVTFIESFSKTDYYLFIKTKKPLTADEFRACYSKLPFYWGYGALRDENLMRKLQSHHVCENFQVYVSEPTCFSRLLNKCLRFFN